MNEQIKQLADEAGIAIWGDAVYMYHPKDTLDSTVMEKFAQLIVRECAWIANDPAPSVYDHDSYKLGRKFAGIDVLKHFGVEE